MTQFLYDFYSAGHLHQLRRLDVKPVENGRDLDVTMTIEALSLPGADRRDQLSQGERSRGSALAKLADYTDVIVRRNLFAPYAPAPREARRPRSIRASTPLSRRSWRRMPTGEVWLSDRLTGKLWKLAEGDAFEVGGTRGTVKTIGARDAVLEFGRPHAAVYATATTCWAAPKCRKRLRKIT